MSCNFSLHDILIGGDSGAGKTKLTSARKTHTISSAKPDDDHVLEAEEVAQSSRDQDERAKDRPYAANLKVDLCRRC